MKCTRLCLGYRNTLRFITHGPKPTCMLIHPANDFKDWSRLVWDATEAMELVKGTKWDILPGPNEPRYGWDEEALSRLEEDRVLLTSSDQSGWLSVKSEDEESDDELDMDDPLWRDETIRGQFAESSIVRMHGIRIESFFSQGKIDEICVAISKRFQPPKYIFVNSTLTASQLDFLESAFNQALNAWQGAQIREKKETGKLKQILGYRPEDEQEAYEEKTDNYTPSFIEVIDRPRMLLELFSVRAKCSFAQLQVSIARTLWMKRNLTIQNFARIKRQLDMLQTHVAPFSERQVYKDNMVIDASQKNLGKSNRELVLDNLTKEIMKLKGKLKIVRSEREKIRKNRQGIVTVAIVGYSNVGKTTLMNVLTGEEFRTRDILFQTVDTHVRRFRLPSGNHALLVDGVGFVQNIPQFLFDAFHATLEEVVYSHIILNLRDTTHPFSDFQNKVVQESLESAGLSPEDFNSRVINVYNKVDMMPEQLNSSDDGLIFISALERIGIDKLLKAIDRKCDELQMTKRVCVPMNRKEAPEVLKFLRSNSLAFYDESMKVSDDGETIQVDVLLDASQINKANHYLPKLTQLVRHQDL